MNYPRNPGHSPVPILFVDLSKEKKKGQNREEIPYHNFVHMLSEYVRYLYVRFWSTFRKG